MTRVLVLAAFLAAVAAWPAAALDFSRQNDLVAKDTTLRTLRIEPPGAASGLVVANGPAGATPSCASTDGRFATDGTQSWEPSCFGAWAATAQGVKVYPTRGTGGNIQTGVPDYKMFSQNLFQCRGNGAEDKESNCVFVNFETVGGSISNSVLDSTNATAILTSVRQRPGPNGERPPTTWGHNVDFHRAPGSGNAQSYVAEWDLNNFSGSCRDTDGCLSAYLFLNGINPFPNTAFIYAGAGQVSTYDSTATIAGTIITRAGGDAWRPGIFRLEVAGNSYHVRYVNPNQLVSAVGDLPTFSSPASVKAFSPMVQNGILWAGANQVGDNDIQLNTSAYNAIRLAGKHNVGIDTSADATRYALIMAADQKVCFNAFSGCLNYDPGNQFLNYSGRIFLHDNGSLTLSNGGASCVHTPGTSAETVSCSSDARLKTDIADAPPALDMLGALRVRSFIETATGRRQTGVVAQEVRETHPGLVHEGSDGMLTVDQPNTWLLVQAVQELRAETDRLRLWLIALAAASLFHFVALFARSFGARRSPSASTL